jgi:uncharacterized membrane protein YphA (DoxX/SURF4 family)
MNTASGHTSESTARTANHLALVGLLVVQLLVGSEWFVSGLTKIVRGGFPQLSL